MDTEWGGLNMTLGIHRPTLNPSHIVWMTRPSHSISFGRGANFRHVYCNSTSLWRGFGSMVESVLRWYTILLDLIRLQEPIQTVI